MWSAKVMERKFKMPDTSKPIPVVAIVDNEPTQQQITSALSSQGEFQLVAVLDSQEKVIQEIPPLDPKIVLIDYQVDVQNTLDTIDELAFTFPDIATVAIIPVDDPLLAQQVMLAGVRGFLLQPFTQVNLLSTLRRVRDLESRRLQSQATTADTTEKTKPLHTLTIFSPRGGVGCSTLAVNLAVALHETFDDRVLLMEGKLLFGHLGLMLNIRAHNTIADLIPHAGTLDTSLVSEIVAEHITGIHVLLSPTDLQVAQGIRPDDMYNVLRCVSKMYDFIVIDAGSYLNENTVTLMDAADRILLVTTPDLGSLHDTSRFIHLSRSLAYPTGKLLTILNRAGMPGGVKTKDIATALHYDLYAQIPDDNSNAIRSLNRGIPLVFKYPRSPASRAIKHLALSLADIGAEETLNAVTGRTSLAARMRGRLASARAG
jgi:pilus assembly protein CpaE